MQTAIQHIPLREVLHFLGWRGSPLDKEWIETLRAWCERVKREVYPRVIYRRFPLEADGRLRGTNWAVHGEDVRALLASCEEVVLFAATLGAESERMLLREQAVSAESALLIDAVLSAAIESVCDDVESQLRREAEASGKYLTDRFSPGYGDMPLEQTKGICRVLSVDRNIGLTVSQSGIMIPRKSVTAVMGISKTPVPRRPSGCEGCSAKETCPMRRTGQDEGRRTTE